MTNRILLLAAGPFPPRYWRRLVTDAWEVCARANPEGVPVVCDFSVCGVDLPFPPGGPDVFVQRAFWKHTGGGRDYFSALIRPGDTVYAFARGGQAAHRDGVDLLDALCTGLGAPLHVRLF